MLPTPFSTFAKVARAFRARKLYEAALKSKYKPNDKSIEIIGLKTPVFTHITTDAVPGTLTQTTFDTDSRADSAQILLTNSTGSSKIIIAAWIRGKPITRLSDGKEKRYYAIGGAGGVSTGRGGGFLHDKFVDYESIAKNGEQPFETGNNFVVTADQVNRLADYYWKLNKIKKHIYTLSLAGFQSWYEPGEWYTLQIGGAGQEEYIDSTVECFDVRCSLLAGETPSTSVSFREVEESWKFDSNEVARQIVAGGFGRRTNQNVVTVAAQYYPGYADYYCDGVDDQEEIQAVIDYMKSGTVRLTSGDYSIGTSLVISSTCSKLEITGDGKKTILKSQITAANGYCIYLAGSAASMVKDISIRDISFYQSATSADNTNLIYGYYVDKALIDNCYFYNESLSTASTNAVHMEQAQRSWVIYNTMEKCATGIWLVPSGDLVPGNNLVQGNNLISSLSFGIYIAGDNNIIINNTISSGRDGIQVLGSYNQISSNRIRKNTLSGLVIASGATCISNIVGNNLCTDNGSDTGIGNANRNNFLDNGTDTQWAG